MGLNGELRQTIVRKSEGTALGSTCASLPRLQGRRRFKQWCLFAAGQVFVYNPGITG